MKTSYAKLVKALTLSTAIMATSACASRQGGSLDNIATSVETASVGSAQVASAAVALPVLVVSGAVLAVGTVAEGVVDWAAGDEPLDIGDETFVADKDPASVMAEQGDCGCE